ncbi:hypothetical protein Tco_0489810 [Tanacetum coccineum]
MDYQCRQAEEMERNRVHEELMQMLREMIKIQDEKRIFEEAARREEEKRIAKEKEAAEKSRIDPTLRNFTISTKRIPLSDFIPPVTLNVKIVNSLRMGDKHLDTQKGSLESSVKDPIPIPSESDVISDGDYDDDYKKCHLTSTTGNSADRGVVYIRGTHDRDGYTNVEGSCYTALIPGRDSEGESHSDLTDHTQYKSLPTTRRTQRHGVVDVYTLRNVVVTMRSLDVEGSDAFIV